jgi:hypothetical protein
LASEQKARTVYITDIILGSANNKTKLK